MTPRRSPFAALLALLLAGAAAAQEADGETPTDRLLGGVFPSVVRVYGAGGFTGIPAYGSGVIVDERGFVLTSWSIALRTDALKVVTAEGRRLPAELWLADPGRGVALLKASGVAAGLPALRLGDSGDLRAGEEVYAFGNPFGFLYGNERPAVMRGVVSAVGPPRPEGVRIARLPDRLEEAIITDIPNNPGTQGGPLVTAEGELVGILGRLVESRATNTILNYAVPAHVVRDFVREGLQRRQADPDAPRTPVQPSRGRGPVHGIRLLRTHLARPPVAYVEEVVRGSPAAAAGVEVDDLIFRVDGRTIRDVRDFDEAMEARAAGDVVALVVKRGDACLVLSLTLEEAPR